MKKILVTIACLLITCAARAEDSPKVSVSGEVHIRFGKKDREAIQRFYARPEPEVREDDEDEDHGRGRDRDEDDDDNPGRGHGHGRGHGRGRGGRGLPPGLAKKGKLPPGIAKQLRRGGVLPPEADEEMAPLPPELDARLQPLPEGHVRAVIGVNVVILDKNTRKVLDIVRDVIQLQRDATR